MICQACQSDNPENAKVCLSCGSGLAATRQLDGERKFVTVLFADVVGSTAMAEGLDPEQVAEIMGGAFPLLNQAVRKYGGTVTRLMGDALLALFGAPIALEDHAEQAVRAGLDIQALAGGYARQIERQYGVEFQVRVGINSGLVVLTRMGDELVTDYTAMGDAANVAARLQSAAEPGRVLVSADTHHLVQNLFDFTPREALTVKGKSAPLQTFEVVAPKETPGKVRGVEGLSSPLVGRDPELYLLEEKLEGLRSNQGAFVAVFGEAGLGKSRLLAELRTQAESARAGTGLRWLEGRSLSYGQTVAYYPWRQVLREAIGAHQADLPEVVRAKLREACERCGVPEGDVPLLDALLAVESRATLEAGAEVTGEALAGRITEAVRGFVAGHARLAPLVVVLDDLHWADEASLELLSKVAPLVESHSFLLVSVLRPDRTAGSWSVVHRVMEQQSGHSAAVMLEPLDPSHSRQLLGNLLHVEDLPDSTRALILAKSEGNPFFIEEVIRYLIDSHHIVREGDHWRATRDIQNVPVPETLAGVLGARIDRLPEHTKRVAQTAAVLGRIFAYRALDGVCALATPPERVAAVEPHVGTLVDEELVRERARAPELEYIFKHALTQEAAYDSLLLRRRKEYHRRVGEVLETLYQARLDDMAPVLAYHFWRGEDWQRAFTYARRAGDGARKVYAMAEALAHYQRACEALDKLPDPPPDELADVILAWAEVGYKVRPYEELLERLGRAERAARDLGDNTRLARALAWTANAHMVAGFPSRGMVPLQESYRLSEGLGDRRLSLMPLFVTTTTLADSDPRSALAQLDEVIAMSFDLDMSEVAAHAIGVKATAHAKLGEFDQARVEIERALELAPRVNSAVKEADVHLLASLTYYDIGDVELGLEHSRIGAQKSLESGALECAAYGLFCSGMGNLISRNVGAAEDAFQHSVQVYDEHLAGQAGTEMLGAMARGGLAAAQASSGRAEALNDMEQALANARAIGDESTVAFLSHALGDGLVRMGDPARAEEPLEAALAFYRRNEMRPYIVRVLESLERLYTLQGRTAEADQARAEFASLSESLWRSNATAPA